jgi:hypothetical protein
MAAHPSGDMFVIDPSCCGPESGPISRILRVTPSGSSSVFVSNERLTGGIGFDGFGDLLVTGFDGPVVNQRSVVWRFSPAGVRSVFASGFTWAYRLVVGPDGDVWVTDQGNNELKRFDALGNLKATIANVSAQDMAFSPAGDLYLSSPEAVWKLVNGTARIFYEPPHPQDVVGLAFNRDGYLYVGEPGYIDYEVSGKVVLLDPQGHSINDPFALANRRPPHNATGMLFTAFLWDGAGNMTNRLWLSSGKETGEEIIELNRSGVGAPGWPKGVNLLALDRAPLRAGVRGVEYDDTLRGQNPPGSVTWTVIAGNLPPGVNLTATTGALRGVPTDTGVFAFTVRATSGSRLAFGRFTVTIGAAPPVAVSVTDVANALMGLATLTPAVVQYLDQHGNNNGVLDVGDLRAFLRAQGQLP